MTRQEEKYIAVLLYIANNIDTPSIGKHQLFKILYFAEREHLASFGRKIVDDDYIKMAHGPVPSRIYDEIKKLSSDSVFHNSFEIVDHKNLRPIAEVDLDELSASELKCLDEAISKYKNLSFTKLKELSHGIAWESAVLNKTIDIKKIAEEGGAQHELIENIQEIEILKETLG